MSLYSRQTFGLTRTGSATRSGAMDAQEDGAELTLLILPLKRSTIDGTADPECVAAPSTHHHSTTRDTSRHVFNQSDGLNS